MATSLMLPVPETIHSLKWQFLTPLSYQMEKAMAPHSSTFVWKIPWMEEPGRLQSMGSLRVGHDWTTSLSLSRFGEGNGNPLQCSCLENARDGGAWWAAIYGITQSRTRLKWLSSSSCMDTIILNKMMFFNFTGTTWTLNPPLAFIFKTYPYPPLAFIFLYLKLGFSDQSYLQLSGSTELLSYHLGKPWISEPSPFCTSALSLLSSVRKPLTHSQHCLVILVYLLS